MAKLTAATEILGIIEDKVLCTDILIYMSPYFHLDKADEALGLLA